MTSFAFSGSVAVVTGAASGIGRQLAGDLCERGARTYGVDLRPFAPAVPSLRAVVCDVSDAAAYTETLEGIEGEEGRLDIVANVAGIDRPWSAVGASLGEYEELMATNFYSAVVGTLVPLKSMVARGHGAIVNVASDSVRTPIAGESGYVATKGALAAFTESVAHEVRDKGVFVKILYPGWVPTPMGQRSLEHGLPRPPRPARRTTAQVSSAVLGSLTSPTVEINTVKGAVLPPLLRAFVPSLYLRAMRRQAMPVPRGPQEQASGGGAPG